MCRGESGQTQANTGRDGDRHNTGVLKAECDAWTELCAYDYACEGSLIPDLWCLSQLFKVLGCRAAEVLNKHSNRVEHNAQSQRVGGGGLINVSSGLMISAGRRFFFPFSLGEDFQALFVLLEIRTWHQTTEEDSCRKQKSLSGVFVFKVGCKQAAGRLSSLSTHSHTSGCSLVFTHDYVAVRESGRSGWRAEA